MSCFSVGSLRFGCRLALALPVVLSVPPAGPAVASEDDVVLVPVTGASVAISDLELAANDGYGGKWVLDSFSVPGHGTLQRDPGGFTFVPYLSFWSLGTDSFTYTAREGRGGPLATATVLLTAAVPGAALSSEDFEDPVLAPGWSIHGSAQVTQGAAHHGSYGLHLPAQEYAYAAVTDEQGPFPDAGSAERGVEITVTPPGGGPQFPLPGGGGGLTDPVLVTAGPLGSPGSGPIELYAIAQGSGVWAFKALLRDPGGLGRALGDDIYVLPERVARIALHWWPRDPEVGAGFLLRVNGQAADWLVDSDSGTWPEIEEVTFGFSRHPTPGPLDWSLDDLALRTGEELASSVERQTSDGFESGSLAAWSNAATSSIDVTAAAAIHGAWGVEARPGDTEPFLSLALPSSAANYQARFAVDTSKLDIAPGGRIAIFSGLDAGGDLFELRLEPGATSSSHTLLLALRIDTGEVTLGATDLPKGAHRLAVQWWSSSGSNADTGFARLWVEGLPSGEAMSLVNPWEVTTARLGAEVVLGSAQGILAFDDFESWREVP